MCLVPVVFLVIGAAGCASTPQPFEYHDDRDEKPGPGLFSGEQGGFFIYGKSVEKKTDLRKKPTDSDL